MPHLRSASDEGAPATAEGALSAFTRDDPRYWTRPRPADHGPNGLYKFGPQEGRPPMVALIAPVAHPPSAPSPGVAHAQMRLRQARARHLLESHQAHQRGITRLARGILGDVSRTPRSRVA